MPVMPHISYLISFPEEMFLWIDFPKPTNASDPIDIFSLKTVELPINAPIPILQFPLITTLVEIWEWSDILTSCSIHEFEFIIQFFVCVSIN